MAEASSHDDGRRGRGFAGMDAERQRKIASRGGRAAHEKGTAHEFSADEARAAGYKGGVSVSQNRAHMAMIGRRGGQARGRRPLGESTGDSASSPTQTY